MNRTRPYALVGLVGAVMLALILALHGRPPAARHEALALRLAPPTPGHDLTPTGVRPGGGRPLGERARPAPATQGSPPVSIEVAKLSPPSVEGSLVAAPPEPIAVSGPEVEGDDCLRTENGARAAYTLDRLVQIMSMGLQAYGAHIDPELARVVIQDDLNRSGSQRTVKAEAVRDVIVAFKNNPELIKALSRPFDLDVSNRVAANGYDPCASPAAVVYGRAFDRGPFADTFSTINPIPVVASRAAATTEGGPK